MDCTQLLDPEQKEAGSLIDVLTPFYVKHDENFRIPLLINAGISHRFIGTFSHGGGASEYVSRLVPKLSTYPYSHLEPAYLPLHLYLDYVLERHMDEFEDGERALITTIRNKCSMCLRMLRLRDAVGRIESPE